MDFTHAAVGWRQPLRCWRADARDASASTLARRGTGEAALSGGFSASKARWPRTDCRKSVRPMIVTPSLSGTDGRFPSPAVCPFLPLGVEAIGGPLAWRGDAITGTVSLADRKSDSWQVRHPGWVTRSRTGRGYQSFPVQPFLRI